MSDSLRRSSRRSKKQSYTVGDIVEISKDQQAQTKGRLVSKLTETSSSNPRWLVAFDDESWTEADMYESSFGQILGKATLAEQVDGNKNKKDKNKQTVAVDAPKTTAKRHGSPVASAPNASKTKIPAVSPSEMEQQAHSNSNIDSSKKSAKEQISFQTVQEREHHMSDSSTLPSDAAKAAAAGISSREQRSKRRQAAIMEEVAQQPNAAQQEPPVKKRKGVTGQYNNGKEEVVKIQMLTGTLYLYKGLRRRAEFVRKF